MDKAAPPAYSQTPRQTHGGVPQQPPAAPYVEPIHNYQQPTYPPNQHPTYPATHQQPMMMQPQPVVNQPINQSQACNANTNVTVNAPSGPGLNIHLGDNKREWIAQLMGCFDDIPTCVAAAVCPICYMLYLSSLLGEGICMPICVPGALIALRTRIRAENKIKGSIFKDCCAAYWCCMCVMCQIRRERDHVAKAKLAKTHLI